MPPNTAKELQTVKLTGQNKIAVIVGGTSGIGAAVARLLAKLGCRRVVISGRSEARAERVLKLLKDLAPEDSEIEVVFVKSDVLESKGMRAAAEGIREAVGDAGIDYLVMTQNGPPTGLIEETADGCERGFAIQAVSRFALAYLLTTGGALAPNAIVMSVCNQGQDLPDLSVDDLSLKQRLGKMSRTGFFMAQSKRDSVVLDSITEEFDYNAFPGFLKYIFLLAMKLIGILAAPDAEKKLGTGRYFDYKLNPKKIGSWASEKKNREEL
ncbi:hypothetical protein FB45DRAFT_1080216 [Roridomyces roridus]|uniref:Uncharacterized protein n=1 Tax=Roridomyces roridus TaxID=1738132 RepID=A0AAD7BRR2_9AGAR|nr:hypothetical protein FB45DRAFT_1080216 [Roridomyces roridus]